MTKKEENAISRRQALRWGAGAGSAVLLDSTAMAQVRYQTPGVYIEEVPAFPNSIIQVATAVPAFIGYTQTASDNGQSLRALPTRIGSLADFRTYFGGDEPDLFALDLADPNAIPGPMGPEEVKLQTANGPLAVHLTGMSKPFRLYDAIRHFYENGGGDCYVVSIGDFDEAIDKQAMLDALVILEGEREPTLIAIPEAMLLSREDAAEVQNAMLEHCGQIMKSRIALLDIHEGYRDRSDPANDPITQFRNSLTASELSYGAAYYPWLRTSLTAQRPATYESLTPASRTRLYDLVNVDPETYLPSMTASERGLALERLAQIKPDNAAKTLDPEVLHKELLGTVPFYGELVAHLNNRQIILPPSAGMAGIMTKVDNDRGVWTAPANIGFDDVAMLLVSIDNNTQADLNAPLSGKSVNAIRAFPGAGTLVWGARTLDGNSNEWRYINVRRLMIMIEQSIRMALAPYVFEPNEASTWETIDAMVSNYLRGLWSRGALQGAKPSDAYNVAVGLGKTMTAQDILEDRLIVSVQLAVVRPAEFMVITLEQTQKRS